MIKTTKIEVPASMREEHERICDLCGEPAEISKDGYNGRWESVQVQHRLARGCGGPYEPFVTEVDYDCCPACFLAKVAPELEALGLKPRKTER